MNKQRRLAAAVLALAALGPRREVQAGLLSPAAHGAKGAWDWLVRPAEKAVEHQGGQTLPPSSRPAEQSWPRSPLEQSLEDFRTAGSKAGSGSPSVRATGRGLPYQLAPQPPTSGRQALLRSVRKLLNQSPRLVFASPKAKAFGQDFLRGARDGTRRLESLRARRPTLVDPWLQVTRDRRVFVIGASQDHPDVVRLRQALKKDGFETFFYKFCEPHLAALCTSGEVGAFFATAGHVVAMRSPAASASSFIPVELAVSHSLSSGGLVVVFTPDDVVKVASAAAAAGLQLGDPSVGFPADVFDGSGSSPRSGSARSAR